MWPSLDPNLNVSANDVYRQGCTPCVVLPFQSVPAECPNELLQQPSLSTDNVRHQWAHTYKEDWLEGRGSCVFEAHSTGVMDPDCLSRARCADPPLGRIVWESNHHSGFAIVNSLITLNIEDIPNSTREVWWLTNTLVPGFVLSTNPGLRDSTVSFLTASRRGINVQAVQTARTLRTRSALSLPRIMYLSSGLLFAGFCQCIQ